MILLTGATGFVGHALLDRMVRESVPVRASVRRINASIPERICAVQVGEINAATDWSTALAGVSVVVHLAARVHVMEETAVDPLAEFRRVNVQGALNLAVQAASAGVKRFIYLSSIKVNGENTLPGAPFVADDRPATHDPYGISKMEAESALRKLAEQSGMEVVIIRPPLVYGRGVKANFLTMMRWLTRGVPLPLGAIHNRRSFVALDNLVDLLMTCVDHPAAVNQTFLVSDGEDMSTTELVTRLALALGTQARLLRISESMIRASAILVGRPELAERLCGNLQLDISKTRNLLNWSPPVSVDRGLRLAAEHYLAAKRNR